MAVFVIADVSSVRTAALSAAAAGLSVLKGFVSTKVAA